MPLSDAARAQWQIHLCVLLWGFTAILGKLISLAALPLVWWRMALVAAMLALAPRVWRSLRALDARRIAAIAGVGVVVALHWLTFYASIKLSNASVAATCMALGSVFTALIEPFAAHRRSRNGPRLRPRQALHPLRQLWRQEFADSAGLQQLERLIGELAQGRLLNALGSRIDRR